MPADPDESNSKQSIARAAHRQLIEAQLTAQLSLLGSHRAQIEINDTPIRSFHVIKARRNETGFVLDIDCGQIDPHHTIMLKKRVIPVLALLQHNDCTVREVAIDFGDHASETVDTIAFCRKQSDAGVLVPDYNFLAERGYEQLKQRTKANSTAWKARSDVVLWRGETTGNAEFAREFGGWLPRVQMCLLARHIDQTDIKIIKVVQSENPAADQRLLTAKGIFKPPWLPVDAWAKYKFAIDIDGNTNSFGTLLQRQLLGCCVLKVNSRGRWRQWFYDRLEPWVHYVPVSADLSDLAEAITWCRDHDDRCREIAEQGRAFAETLGYNIECRAAVRRINSTFPGSAASAATAI